MKIDRMGKGRHAGEIEITPEMIEAGVRVYHAWLDEPGDRYLTSHLVNDIHRVMVDVGLESKGN